MNTTLHHSSTHPPDTEDRLVLQIPAPDELRELSAADRLSFKIGLWLLERAQRPRRSGESDDFRTDAHSIEERLTRAREQALQAAYWHQRQIL